MHEQSETIQLQNGKWVNVYGKGVADKAGHRLPQDRTGIGHLEYGSMEEAVDAARRRSDSHDDNAPTFMQAREEGDARYVDEQLRIFLGGSGERETQEAKRADVAEQPGPTGSLVGGAKDVARGVTELPRAVYTGAHAAVQETIDLIGETGDYLESIIPLGSVTPEFMRIKKPTLPGQLGAPVSQTGKLTKSVFQFLTGFMGAGRIKMLKGLTPGVSGAARGAAADFAVFDPHEERLSNLIQENPGLANPVTAFLAADPADSAAEGRLKNALEGAIPGAMIDGFTQTLKIIKSGRAARGQVSKIDSSTGQPKVERENAFAALGEPDNPDLLLSRVERKVSKAAETAPLDVSPVSVTKMISGQKRTKKLLADELAAGRVTTKHGFRSASLEELVEIVRTGQLQVGVDFEGRPGISAHPIEAETTVRNLGDGIIVPPEALTPSGRAGEVLVNEKLDPKKLRYVVNGKALSWDELRKQYPPRKTQQEIEAEEWLQAQTADPNIEINFARIQTPDDVQKLMQMMADLGAKGIKKAQRGVRTWEKTKVSAAQRNAWSDLMNRRQGEAFNAEQAVAARQLWVASAEKLAQVSKLAADNPSEANLFAFRKMLATHYAIQKEVLAARTEAGRALDAWRIPAGGSGELGRNIDMLLENAGGAELSRDLAKRISLLADNGMSKELERLVEGSMWARTKDAVLQVWINGLLSNPTTHMVNTMSNFAVIGMQLYERRVAAHISKIIGTDGGVEMTESMAQLSGMLDGFKDALRAGWKQRGMSFLPEDVPGVLGGQQKLERMPKGALSADAWHVANDTWYGQALNGVDVFTRLPGQALRIGDEFFKTIGYRMQLHALAARTAAQDVAAGKIPFEQMKLRQAEIIRNPPDDIKLDAIDAALYQTFTNKPTNLFNSNKLATAVQDMPLIGRLIMPFKNTPLNLFSYTFERTPLAPLTQQFRADFAAGGARRDLALARMSTGTMIMLAAMDMAFNGTITGKAPKEPGARQHFMRENKQEYSIKVGDRYYSYNRADPIGMTLGMAADLAQTILNMNESEDLLNKTEEVLVGAVFSIAKNVTSKTYMSGIAEFFDAVSDPDRYGEKWFQRAGASFMPAGMAQFARAVDPYMRTANDMLEAVQRRTPWWSEGLPLYRDLWGRPVDYRSGFGWAYDAFSPIYSRKEKIEPIDGELARLEYFPTMPDRRLTHNGVLLDLELYPHIYSRYVELAGNAVKHPAWGMGAKDFLNSVVSGKHDLSYVYDKVYSDGPEGSKVEFIRSTLREFRELATEQIMVEFPELQVEYEQKRDLYKDINRNLIR